MNVLDVNNEKTIEVSKRQEPEANNDDNIAVVMDTNNTDNSGSIVNEIVDQPQVMSKQSIVMSMLCMGNGASGEMLNLREILQLFNCAISQEQAWAVLYQVLSKLKYLLDNDLTLVKLNQDTFDINALNFTKDGAILFNFKHFVDSSSSSSSYMNESDDEADLAITRQNQQHLTKNDLEQERNDIESKVLKSVAYLIFDALDYGNTYMNEPVLQSSLSHLLLLISGHYKEYNNGRAISEDDEGYEQEEEDSIDIDKAIEICNNNLAEAEYHCKAVCRGLYAQAYELKVFLAKIEDSKNILQKSGKDPTHYCFEVLDKTDWVIHELRNGVKLRKVCEKPEVRRHIEYELTPFEILLDQIRARRYHLKKVSLDASLGPEIKKDARDIILEFIRSRPPLKKCSQRTIKQSARVLAKSKSQPVNLHEQLMISIRNYSTPLRKIEHLKVAKNTNPESTNETTRQPKRLIKADKKLLNNLTSSDDDDSDIDYEELKNLPILQEDDDAFVDSIYMLRTTDADNNFSNVLMNLTSASSSSSNAVAETKKRIKAPESLRSPLTPWRDPVENWRALVTEDVLDELGTHDEFSAQHRSANNQNHHRTPGSKMPNRRHTMTFADLNRVSSTLASINIFSGFGSGNGSTGAKIQQQKSLTSHSESREFASDSSCKKKLTSNSGDANNKECLRLTFDELCHIRNVLTKAELDYLLFDNQIYQEVSKGKVCFSCRKTKFHLFNWGTKCRICQQKICKKCLRTAQLKNGQMAQVPVFKLSPTKYKLKLENTNPHMNNKPECLKTEYEPISCDQHAANHQHHYHHRTATSTASPPGSQLFEICVDCYQMMEGVVVSANERDLVCETDAPLASSSVDPDARSKFTSAKPTTTTKVLNIKNHDKGDTMDSLPSSMSPSPSSVKSTEEILNMLVIKDLNIVDHSSTATSTNTITTLNNNNNANGGANYASPLSFHSTLSHHSTPNLKTSIVIEHDVDDDSDDKPMDDLSTIILTDNQLDSTSTTSSASFQTTPGLSTSSSSTNANILNTNNDTQNSNPKFIRENLTLDLHPVYVNYHHHHHHHH